MTTHGGKRPGAGRPREASARRLIWHVRVTDGDEGARLESGEDQGEYLTAAIAARRQIEDANMTGPIDERVRDAIATYAACDAIIGLLHETRSHRQLTPTEQEVLRLAVGEVDEREVAQLRRAVRGLKRGMTRRDRS